MKSRLVIGGCLKRGSGGPVLAIETGELDASPCRRSSVSCFALPWS